MKPRIVNIIPDDSVGGVHTCVEDLERSELAKSFEFVRLFLAQAGRLSTLSPALVLIHSSSRLRQLPLFLSLKRHAPVVICEHHYSVSPGRNPFILGRFWLMLWLYYHLADRVVLFSQAQFNWIRSLGVADPDRLRMIRQARDLRPFLAVPPKPRNGPLQLAVVGRLAIEKGVDILLRAMALLPSGTAKLLVAGDGPERARLEAMAPPGVEFLGIQTDVPALLAICDAVVIPSRREVWGFVCMEAKAAARPVVATRVGGLVEQIKDCGLLVPSQDPAALADAIRHLSELDPMQLQQWGERGRADVVDAWPRYLAQWQELLWDTVGSCAGSN